MQHLTLCSLTIAVAVGWFQLTHSNYKILMYPSICDKDREKGQCRRGLALMHEVIPDVTNSTFQHDKYRFIICLFLASFSFPRQFLANYFVL